MQKVAIVGVEGSGKTVLMAALGDKYKSPDDRGVFLKPLNRKTYAYYTRTVAQLRDGAWPLATESGVLALSWGLMRQSGRMHEPKQLGELSFLDFGGEIYRLAFGDGAQINYDEERGKAVSLLREHVSDADVVIVLINLSDIINGNATDERTIEMGWLSQKILDYTYEKAQKTNVALMFTQTDSYAETIKRYGGVRGALKKYLSEVDASYGNRLTLFTISAVNKTRHTSDGVLVPASDFDSEGLGNLMAWVVDGVAQKYRVGEVRFFRLCVCALIIICGIMIYWNAEVADGNHVKFCFKFIGLSWTLVGCVGLKGVINFKKADKKGQRKSKRKRDTANPSTQSSSRTQDVNEKQKENGKLDIRRLCVCLGIIGGGIVVCRFSGVIDPKPFVQFILGGCGIAWIVTGLICVIDTILKAKKKDEQLSASDKSAETILCGMAADNGDAQAQFNLGVSYANGDGVKKNMREAVKWYRKAAEHGHAQAQNELGECYAKGLGVEKDEREAAKWYRKAAEQGNMSAQSHLGWCYGTGAGVEKDERKAVKWFRKAAEQGYVDAQFGLGSCYAYAIGVKEDECEAVKWWRMAAEQGCKVAQFNLGECYTCGTGVEKDVREAVKWYRMAAEQGDRASMRSLEKCYRLGIGVSRDKNEAEKWGRLAKEKESSR